MYRCVQLQGQGSYDLTIFSIVTIFTAKS